MDIKRITDLPVAGTITGDEVLEISQPSTTVSIAATTISATNSDNSFNDSAAGFVAAGFVVGNRVRVTGFTSAGNNVFVGVVTAVTAGKLTIGGTDGNTIVDEAAGDSVVISKWESRRITFYDVKAPYIIPLAFEEGPVANEVLVRHVFSESVTFPDNWAGSAASVGVNPTTNPFVLTIQQNGGTVGTISIASTGVVTFNTTGGDVDFVSGDLLTVIGPATPDATLASGAFSLRGRRI